MTHLPLLHSEQHGGGNSSFILMHGLLGSSRNWRSVARELSKDFSLHCLDLRNHGNSFHNENAGIEAMSDDLLWYADHYNIPELILCGHSLGGKVAMRFACDHPTRIRKLIIADIAPRDYPSGQHIPTLDALLEINLQTLQSRKHADELLAVRISNWAFRQFLVTTLVEDGSAFRWKANIRALRDSIDLLSSNPLAGGDQFDEPTLFIRGGKSGYLRSEHLPEIIDYFPSAKFEILTNAGHDLHVEDRAGFLSAVREFLVTG